MWTPLPLSVRRRLPWCSVKVQQAAPSCPCITWKASSAGVQSRVTPSLVRSARNKRQPTLPSKLGLMHSPFSPKSETDADRLRQGLSSPRLEVPVLRHVSGSVPRPSLTPGCVRSNSRCDVTMAEETQSGSVQVCVVMTRVRQHQEIRKGHQID